MAEAYPEVIAFKTRKELGGEWKTWTYSQVQTDLVIYTAALCAAADPDLIFFAVYLELRRLKIVYKVGSKFGFSGGSAPVPVNIDPDL